MSDGFNAGCPRGVVGVIKPTYRPGSLEEFIRLLPDGVGVIPTFIGIREGRQEEFAGAFESAREKIAMLASLKVDLIHPEGGPLFMFKGYENSERLVRELEREYSTPIVTTGMVLVEAAKALGLRKMVVMSHFDDGNKERFQRYRSYFTDAGFEVLAAEGIPVGFTEIGRLSPYDVYSFAKKLHLRHSGSEGICMIGSGWRGLHIIELLERDLQVPVVHPVTARVWAVQKRLHLRQPVNGCGSLLERMP